VVAKRSAAGIQVACPVGRVALRSFSSLDTHPRPSAETMSLWQAARRGRRAHGQAPRAGKAAGECGGAAGETSV